MLKPLDDVQKTVSLISRVSDVPEAIVRERLLKETTELGMNVYAAVKEQGIPMYQASEKLDRFYQESDAFLYETTAWNTCAAKQQMRDFISSRLKQFGKTDCEIFCFGDGLGFDSTHLALEGHRTTYFEPSLRCQDYAKTVFKANGVTVNCIDGLSEIAPNSLDVVVCLDVLEHVQQPQELVKLFHSWLKPDGLFFVHAPYWAIHWTRPTHLKENRRYTGNLKRLYTSQGFSVLDSSIFWDPLVFQKSDHQPAYKAPFSASLRIRTAQFLLKIARYDGWTHTWIARQLAKVPRSWKESLQALDCSASLLKPGSPLPDVNEMGTIEEPLSHNNVAS